jgi:phosphate transport system substrate-binding protein
MSFHRFVLTLAVGALCGLCASCGGSGGNTLTLQGAGATFPAPLYQRWFAEYNKVHPDVQINYSPVGSSTGIKQFTDRLVNFGASDAAMTDEEMAQVSEGVQLLPMTAGIVVLAYNTDGMPEDLKLSREALAGICLGTITKWNNPEIAKANPGASLPDKQITFVRRSEGSGTSFVFTTHLSAISKAWKEGPGVSTSPTWPVGVGGKGNDGVAALIKQTPGAIGYVEYAYAEQTKLPMAWLQNHDKEYIKPSLEAGKAALAGFELPPNLRAWIPDPKGKDAYPIVTYTWLLCYKKYQDEQVGKALKDLLKYCLGDGQKISPELGYITLPDKVVGQVTKALDNITP